MIAYQFLRRFLVVWIFISVIFLLAFIPWSAQALLKQSEEIVFVGSDEVIDDNLVIFADFADIQGEIRGDLILAVGSANIKGVVAGDVLGVAGDITISGPVEGDVRVAAGTINVNSTVGGNVNAVGGKTLVGSEAEVGHSLSIVSGILNLNGAVVKNINGIVGQAAINAPVGGDIFLNIDSDGQLILSPEARIGGNINYVSGQEIRRLPGAEVAGIIRKIELPIKGSSSDKLFSGLMSIILSVGIFGLLVVGLLLIKLFPGFARRISDTMVEHPGRLIAWGFVYFWLIPLAIILFAITIIGLPLAFIVASLYKIFLYIAVVFASLAVGRWLLKKINKTDANLLFSFVIGIIIITILIIIPFIGWFIGLVFIWWGLAALVDWCIHRYRTG